ncbi:CBO0543 family protein [Paenibacillus sp. Y412MC10]|uniref:CBO0543 family protein n=1 Tax=Geobacillus sp. (strain Y412MC10) TaxID=481743 RepID=UPI0011AB4FC9|nr:CBO0543 family protein [Paenibacillus sp. Y412MC10]
MNWRKKGAALLLSDSYPSFEAIKDAERKLREMRKLYYYGHDLFSIQWWLLLVLLIVPWIVWWKMVDKSRLKDILLYGFALTIIIVLLDDIGRGLGLWSYPHQVFRLIPRLSSIDYSVLPVIHMLIYQYFRSWKSFFVANVILALGAAFIAEPLFVWIDIYDMDHWKSIYSFPLYIAKACFVKWSLEFMLSKANRSQQKPAN